MSNARRKMTRADRERVQAIIVNKFGNVWRTPKSVRKNYANIDVVETKPEAARIPQGDRNE